MIFTSFILVHQCLNVLHSSEMVFAEGMTQKYSNSWAVQLQPFADNELELHSLALTLGLTHRKIFGDYYLLTDKQNWELADIPNEDITNALKSNRKVKWVEQQVVEEYSARSLSFNDADWNRQWYLKETTAGRITHNVEAVWEKGYTGRKTTVVVIDGGVRKTHKEFEGRYDESVSQDLVQDSGPPSSEHGTKCAGVIAAAAGGNGLCGVGVAYHSTIGGVRLFNKELATDAAEASAFFPSDAALQKVDIFSNSWGPLDNGYTIRAPKTLAAKALERGIQMGRGGRGFIYVFSSGNGGFPFGDSCAFDGYVNSIYTISVASVGQDGTIPKHSERCGAIMTSVYSHNLVTVSNKSDTECVYNFGQTSAAAAFVSGIIALALEANSKLSWRDVQHLIARSSSQKGVKDSEAKWVTNKAGFTVSEYLGFGVLDPLTLVNYAEKWNVSVPTQRKCNLDLATGERDKPIPVTLSLTLRESSCRGGIIKSLEHVQLKVNLQYSRRGGIAIDVTSPSNTKSRFVYPRVYDAITERTSYSNLVTTSLHFWGEPTLGTWSVTVKNGLSDDFQGNGTSADVGLIFYGTSESFNGNSVPNGNGSNINPNDDGPSSSKVKLIVSLVSVFAVVTLSTTAAVIYCWWQSIKRRRIPGVDVVLGPTSDPNKNVEIGASNTLPGTKKTYV